MEELEIDVYFDGHAESGEGRGDGLQEVVEPRQLLHQYCIHALLVSRWILVSGADDGGGNDGLGR